MLKSLLLVCSVSYIFHSFSLLHCWPETSSVSRSGLLPTSVCLRSAEARLLLPVIKKGVQRGIFVITSLVRTLERSSGSLSIRRFPLTCPYSRDWLNLLQSHPVPSLHDWRIHYLQRPSQCYLRDVNPLRGYVFILRPAEELLRYKLSLQPGWLMGKCIGLV